MSRGIPGYPGGLPRGSAGEAGPVPPRPLPFGDFAEDPKPQQRWANGECSFPDLRRERRLL